MLKRFVVFFYILVIAMPRYAIADTMNSVVVKPATGQDYLNILAAQCDGKTWGPISEWAERTGFANKSIPQVEGAFDGTTFKLSASNHEYKIENGKITTTINGKKVSGTSCELMAQWIGSKKAEKSASINWLLPYAYAEDSEIDPGDDTPLGLVLAGAIAGCAGGAVVGGVVGLIFAPLTAGAGCAVGGVLGGLTGMAASIFFHNQNVKAQDAHVDLARLDNSSLRIRSCSPTSIQISNGTALLNIFRRTKDAVRADFQLSNNGSIVKRWSGQIDARMSQCSSARDVGIINAQLQTIVARRLALPARKLIHINKTGVR